MTTTTRAPEAPPLRRDTIAHAWLGLGALSDAGDQVWTIALAWTAVHVASPAAAGLVVAAGTVPRALVLLFGGVVADRYDARSVMVLANGARLAVLAVLLLRVAVGPPSLPVLLLAAVAFGLTDAVYEPSASTISRQLVRPTDLPAYAGLGQTLSRLGSMGGAAVGGFVVAAWGLGGSAAVDALTFLCVVVFLVGWLRPRYPLPRAAAEPALVSIRRGFAHLRDEPLTRTLVIALSGLNLFVGPAEGVGLALRARAEGWGAGSVGVCLALRGGGAALGSVVMVRWAPRREAAAGFLWLAVQGVAIVLLGVGPRWLTGAAAFAIGVTAGVASVLLSAVFQATVDGAYLGRMSALQRLGDDVLMPAAMAGFGALATVSTIPVAFAVYGGAMALLMVWPLSNPALRAIRLRPG